jgi:hypothetical protein
MSPSRRQPYRRSTMTLDRRAVVLIIVAIHAVVLLLAVARGPIGFGPGDGGPGGACPPGHVTTNGCSGP